MNNSNIYGTPVNDEVDPNRMSIPVNGVGEILINRTHEGLIVDVFGLGEASHSLASIALMNEDVLNSYADAVQDKVCMLDRTICIDEEDVAQYFDNRLSVEEAAIEYLKGYEFDPSTLIPLKGWTNKLIFTEKSVVAYLSLTPEVAKVLPCNEADFFMTNDGVVIFSLELSDGSVNLFPVLGDYAQEILSRQTIFGNILRSGELSPSIKQELHRIGFSLASVGDSCYDFVNEFSPLNSSSTRGNHNSFAVRASFNVENSQLDLSVGLKSADGFDSEVRVISTDSLVNDEDKDLRAMVRRELSHIHKQIPSFPLYLMSQKYSSTFNDLLNSLDELSILLQKTPK